MSELQDKYWVYTVDKDDGKPTSFLELTDAIEHMGADCEAVLIRHQVDRFHISAHVGSTTVVVPYPETLARISPNSSVFAVESVNDKGETEANLYNSRTRALEECCGKGTVKLSYEIRKLVHIHGRGNGDENKTYLLGARVDMRAGGQGPWDKPLRREDVLHRLSEAEKKVLGLEEEKPAASQPTET